MNLCALLLRFMEPGLFLAAHKLVLFAAEVKWCDKIYSGAAVRHDPERVHGLVEKLRRETEEKLMQLLKATNWIRLSLPHVLKIMTSLPALMELRLKGMSYTKRVASRRALTGVDRTPERVEAFDNSREMLINAVGLSSGWPDGCRMVMFPDAGNMFSGCCLTQVPKKELVVGPPTMSISQERLAFLDGVFGRLQLC